MNEDDFSRSTQALLDAHGQTLLRIAEIAIQAGLADGRPGMLDESGLDEAILEDGASFVTLKKNGQLRGCIGSVEAHRPLALDVAENAFAAAFRDSRFSPLEEDEMKDIALSVTVLSPSQPMEIVDEADLLGQLRPGVDGLIIEDQGHRALFLPAVWESLPDAASSNCAASSGYFLA